jgi:FkbM family methyltransferase
MSYIDTAAETDFFDRQKEMMRRIGISSAPCIFDVGANIGQSIEGYRSLFPDARMASFEPLPDCFATMRERFGATAGVTLNNLALADTPGKRSFHVTKCRTASSLLPPDTGVQKKSAKGNYDYELIEVQADTLDRYCDAHKIDTIDILKIDVQGAETQVLRGAQAILQAGRVRMLYMEVIFADNYQGQCDLQSITALLSTHRYLLWDVRPFLFTKAGRLWTANAVFVSSATAQALEAFPDEFPQPRL